MPNARNNSPAWLSVSDNSPALIGDQRANARAYLFAVLSASMSATA